jgi:hypothetical protein
MTIKAKVLRDLADAFHGVTSASIHGEAGSAVGEGDALPCRVIYQPDIVKQGPWRDPLGVKLEMVARRFVEAKRRGLGQSSGLRLGDVLVSTRGRIHVSPLVTNAMLSGSPMVAGPDVIVVRAKDGFDPAVVRKALLAKNSATFLRAESRKELDGQVRAHLKKSSILDLPLPPGFENTKYFFDERLESHASDTEAAAERIAALSRAFVELARWRSELRLDADNRQFDLDTIRAFSWEAKYDQLYQDISARSHARHTEILDATPLSEIGRKPDWSWKLPFDDERRRLSEQRDRWASEGIVKGLKDIATGNVTDRDSRLLCELLAGSADCARARSAMKSDPQLVQNTTLLLHQGHYVASSMNVRRSIRSLLASCVKGLGRVVVLSAETGNQAVEVVTGLTPPKQVALVESNDTYLSLADALCRFVTPGVEVHSAKTVSGTFVGEKIDGAVLEASGFDADVDDEKLEQQSRLLFDWSNLGWRLRDGGKLFVHLPTTHWKLLSEVRSHVTAVVQLPPLIVPARQPFRRTNDGEPGKETHDRHALCDQGLILVIEPGSNHGGKVRVVDATMLTRGDAVTELTQDQLDILRSVILHKDLSFSGLRFFHLDRSMLGTKSDGWPGVARFLAARASGQELAEGFSLETIIEEMQFCHRAWKLSQGALFAHVGAKLKL